MTKEEILLKHLTEGRSERMKRFVKLVNRDLELMAMEEYAQQAIAEYEQAQWKKYPENVPDEKILYLCQCDTEIWEARQQFTNPYGFGYWIFAGYQIIHEDLNVIAFRELPESYKAE